MTIVFGEIYLSEKSLNGVSFFRPGEYLLILLLDYQKLFQFAQMLGLYEYLDSQNQKQNKSDLFEFLYLINRLQFPYY